MRQPDWETSLTAYVASVRNRPFEWGAHDCILFSASAIEAQTGIDIAAEYRGRYHNRGTANKILKSKGNGTLLRTLDATLERRKPSRARRGDLVWFEGSVGVCMGGVALFVGEERLAEKAGALMRDGLISIPRRLCTKAWAI